VLLEFENTLVGIFVRVIAIVFDHAPAENCQRYWVLFLPDPMFVINREDGS
jgi:hypothetical protein